MTARLELDPRVAVRPEPFGALAYHYGTRRLTFLRSPDLVALVRTLGEHPDVGAALEASDIEPRRWPSFRRAVESLAESGFVRPADGVGPVDGAGPVDDVEAAE